MIKAVFFDFGGVIIENVSSRSVIDVIASVLKETGFNLTDSILDDMRLADEKHVEKIFSTLIEVRIEDYVEFLLKVANAPISKELINQTVKVFESEIKYNLRKGVKTVLKDIREMGLKIGLISNSFTTLPRRILEAEGLLHFFDSITISCEVGYRKPHPKIFMNALESLKIKGEDAVFIGDVLEVDISGAKNVGMKTILIKSRENEWKRKLRKYTTKLKESIQPDFTIEELSEVSNIIRKLL